MSSHSRCGRAFSSVVLFIGLLFAADSFATIVSVQAVSQSSQPQKDVPVTFGEIFKDGDVPPGAYLTATVGGQPVPIQVDRKAVNPDGSLRHAVVTVVLPDLPAFATGPIDLSLGAPQHTAAPVSLDDVLATDFDAHVSLNIGGKEFTADARQLLQQAKTAGACRPWSKECNAWLSGPQVSEWIVGGPVTSAGVASPHIAAYFYIRAYRGNPVTRIRVNVAIENDWSYVPEPQNVSYAVTIKVGDNVYAKPDITHYVHARWHKVMWWGDKPEVYAKLDSLYIQASKAVSQYADIHPTEAFLNSVRQSVAPMDNGDQMAGMPATGAQPGIGPLPRWTTGYLLGADRRAYYWMLANDDAAGSYGVFYRDKDTGRPITILDYPYMTISGTHGDTYNSVTGEYEAFPTCGGDCSTPYVPNTAHEPSIAYVPYMVTGDFYYLEQMQFWTNWNELRQNPYYRDHAEGMLYHCQVRCQAWALRSLADTAYITPDNDPLKAYFVNMVRTNIQWYNDHYTNNPDADKLHIISHHAVVYDNNGEHSGPNVRFSPWMDDFFTWSIGHLAELGVPGAAALSRWKSRFQVDLMTAPDFCWLLATSYTFRVRDTETSPLYTSVGEIYRNQFPSLVGLGCNTPAMLSAAGLSMSGEMYGHPESPVGYPANLQPALAAAVDSGIPGAAEAWQRFATRANPPDYGNYANFAVVPRQSAGVSKPRIGFYASPNPVEPGEHTTLHWSASGADTCSAKWLDGTAASGEQTIGPIIGKTAYAITCSGSGGTATATLTVVDTTVKKPAIMLTASPSAIRPGQIATLSWHAENANHCAASGGWSGQIPIRGDEVVGPLTADTEFTMTCAGIGGSGSRTASVHVQSVDQQVDVDADADNSAAAYGEDDDNSFGGIGAFGLFGYAWLLGAILLLRRRRSR